MNVCRFEGVDPEIALTGTTERFIKRFSYIENELAGSGKTPYESTLEEMDALWNEAKKHEKDIFTDFRHFIHCSGAGAAYIEVDDL